VFNEQTKITLILGTICSILMVLISYLGVTDNFKNSTFDLFSRYLNPEIPADAGISSNVILVEIDQRSLDDINKEGINWPWPRQLYAPIIEYLSDAKAVFIDVLYTEPSSYGYEDDQLFAEAIKDSANVYMPVFLTDNYYELNDEDTTLLQKVSIKQDVRVQKEFRSAINPIDIYKESIVSAGNVTLAPDNDGIYRRMSFFFKVGDYIIPHFLLNFLIKDGVVSVDKGRLLSNGKVVPQDKGLVILNYYSKEQAFESFSASYIIKSYLDSKNSQRPAISKDFFKDKIVLIGLTAPGLYDLRPTSVASISTGINIHATTLDNFYNNRFINKVPDIVVYLLILAICFFSIYYIFQSPSFLRNLSYFVIVFLVINISDVLLFNNHIYLNFIDPVFSLIVSFIVAVAYSYATEGKMRELTEKTLLQYMDKQVASYLLNNPSLIKPGGMKKRVTIFFADIAGFTTLAENTTPEEISRILIDVLNLFTDEIIEKRGVIDKYIGDCVMAFWGAPIESDNDEINACMAAVASIKLLEQKNREFESQGLPKISFRVGIHSGEAIVGNLGSDRVFDYTVVGDSVNLASRMESLNKFFSTKILISAETLSRTKDVFLTREIGPIEVKGKSIPTVVYELLDVNEKADENTRKLVDDYNMALNFYNNAEFTQAKDKFDEISVKYGTDGPSDFLNNRCIELIGKNDLTKDWKVIKFDSK